MSHSESASTRSGWQSFDARGRRTHTYFWVPEEYGILGQDGKPIEGSLCYNCGRWNGPKPKRGAVRAFLQRGKTPR